MTRKTAAPKTPAIVLTPAEQCATCGQPVEYVPYADVENGPCASDLDQYDAIDCDACWQAANEAERAIWDLVAAGTITQEQAMQQVYGD